LVLPTASSSGGFSSVTPATIGATDGVPVDVAVSQPLQLALPTASPSTWRFHDRHSWRYRRRPRRCGGFSSATPATVGTTDGVPFDFVACWHLVAAAAAGNGDKPITITVNRNRVTVSSRAWHSAVRPFGVVFRYRIAFIIYHGFIFFTPLVAVCYTPFYCFFKFCRSAWTRVVFVRLIIIVRLPWSEIWIARHFRSCAESKVVQSQNQVSPVLSSQRRM